MLLAVLSLASCTPVGEDYPSPERVTAMVQRQLQQYPQSRLVDIYKTCFQDYMGPEHLVTDSLSARRALTRELADLDLDSVPQWMCEPCGTDSMYYRVSLRAIAQGRITEAMLLDAFIASSQQSHPTVRQWQRRWRHIQQVIDDMHLNLPHYSQDSTAIAGMLDVGDYVLSHSDQFRNAYHPHYRLVSREIMRQGLEQDLEMGWRERAKR